MGWVALTALGAAGCLFVTLVLAGRLLELLRPTARGTEEPPVRVPGGRRAAR